MKKIALIGLAALALLLTGCGQNKSDVEASAKKATQQIIDTNPALKNLGLVVDRVDVVQEDSHKYKGIAQVSMDGEHHQVAVSISADKDMVIVNTDDGAFLFATQKFMQKSMQDAEKPEATPAP